MCEVIIIFNDNIHVYFILGNCWWAIINSENSWQVGLGWLATSCSPSDHKQLPLPNNKLMNNVASNLKTRAALYIS